VGCDFLFRGFWTEFQNVAWLAVKRFADRFQRGETDGLGLAVLWRDRIGVMGNNWAIGSEAPQGSQFTVESRV